MTSAVSSATYVKKYNTKQIKLFSKANVMYKPHTPSATYRNVGIGILHDLLDDGPTSTNDGTDYGVWNANLAHLTRRHHHRSSTTTRSIVYGGIHVWSGRHLETQTVQTIGIL